MEKELLELLGWSTYVDPDESVPVPLSLSSRLFLTRIICLVRFCARALPHWIQTSSHSVRPGSFLPCLCPPSFT